MSVHDRNSNGTLSKPRSASACNGTLHSTITPSDIKNHRCSPLTSLG
ncbi:Protein of unknown function [Pyronema omphalodes CBS 100304]|uniref:Uncharacterized protein n=1 Tax=Pyronema omphalodes (strain CBS 100304) TaxID=1076935 RepID=U4LCP6_PYROM|nr:Protein of unknown function [Pyronema omphalodes CBS 100304]